MDILPSFPVIGELDLNKLILYEVRLLRNTEWYIIINLINNSVIMRSFGLM